MDLSPRRQEAVIRLALERGRVDANTLSECRAAAAERKTPERAVSALDVLVEREILSNRDVQELACLEAVRVTRQARIGSAVVYALAVLVALGFGAFLVWKSGRSDAHDPAALTVRRPNRDAIQAPDDSRATYEAMKEREIEQGARRLREREDVLAKRKAAELVRQAEEGRRLEAEERNRREAEQAARAAELKKREEEAAARAREGKELEEARAVFERFLPEIENYVRLFSYRKALDEYAKFRASLRFDELKQRIDRRVEEVRKLDDLMTRLKTAVNGKTLRDDQVKYGESDRESGTLAKADDEALEVVIPQGFIRTRWDFMRPAQMVDLFRRMKLTPDDEFLLGCFCWESDLVPDANAFLLSALRQKKDLKPEIDTVAAARRGFARVPAGGFVPHQGRLVTVEEKSYFDRGFVSYGGLWIKPEEKVYVDKGWVKQDDKWLPREEAELLAKGYRKYKEKWYSADELAALRSNWSDAWEVQSPHYLVRTNTTEAACKELADVMEQSFAAYTEHYGRTYTGAPMHIYAFRTFEDYRAFCIAQKVESLIPAAGHANGFKNYGCGYAKYGGTAELIATVVHEGAHLFYDRAVKGMVPSWFHEGQATYFEGYTYEGGKMTFHQPSRLRLVWLRQALLQVNYVGVKDLIQGDALTAINQGARDSTLFYSESWGLYYFLCHTGDEGLKAKFKELREKYATRAFGPAAMVPQGALASFTGVMGDDFDDLEAKWREFILGLGN